MKRIIFVIAVFFFFNNAFAVDNTITQDSIHAYLSTLRQIMQSPEWGASDSANYRRFNILLEHLLDEKLDEVVTNLENELLEQPKIFSRDTSDIPKNIKIPGSISDDFIQHGLDSIQQLITERIPVDSIKVPDEAYAGMYAKLDFVWSGEYVNMAQNELIDMPDSIRTDLLNDTLNHQISLPHGTDSAMFALLDSIRSQYNNELILAYRDSVSVNYREKYIDSKIIEKQQPFIDSVNHVNQLALIKFNQSEIDSLNNWAWHNLKPVLERVKREPNKVFIYNMKNDSSELLMQYDEDWFKWFYLKNMQNDSIGIKIVNIDRDKIKIYIDESINLSRLVRKKRADITHLIPEQELSLKLHQPVHRKIYESPWKFGGRAYAGFTQTYINSYWAKGGNTSASALSTFKYYANYSMKKVKWENSIDSKLGLVYYLPDEEESTSDGARNYHKNSDNIDINSKLGISAFKNWYYSTEFVFKTQFFRGYKNKEATEPQSSFFAPAYLNFSIGLDYKPNKKLSLMLSPLTLKTTFVKEHDLIDETRYGLNEGETSKISMGISGTFKHKRELIEDVNVETDNTLFINLSKNNEGERQWNKFPDLDSETTFDFKVNQFISTQLNFHFIYDKDIVSSWTVDGEEQTGTKLQVKEFVTLGLTYKFLR